MERISRLGEARARPAGLHQPLEPVRPRLRRVGGRMRRRRDTMVRRCRLAKILSFAAAATAALTPILGKEILSVGNESKWIAARAIAEAIKSECFRFAAKVDDYAGADALDRFIAKREALTQTAAEAKITPADDPIPAAGDKRKPSVPLDPEWYLDNRVTDQIKFYANGQHRHEQAISRLRLVSFGAAVVAALFGVAGSMGYGSFAPW